MRTQVPRRSVPCGREGSDHTYDSVRVPDFVLKMCGYKNSRLVEKKLRLTSESVQGASLAFQGVDNIHGGDCLPLGVLGVGDSISDHIFKEDLEDSSSFFVDQSADSLYSTTTRQTTDGWLRNSLDVVTKNLSMTLGASFSQSLSSFASSRHLDFLKFVREFKPIREDVVDYKIVKDLARYGKNYADSGGATTESQSESTF